jgi:hypothetical protein
MEATGKEEGRGSLVLAKKPGGWEKDEESCGRAFHPMLLDGMPFRTRVKKEGKRMYFIFQFLIVSHSWQLFWPSKKGSCGWFWERKSKSKGSGGKGSCGWFWDRKSKSRGSGGLLFYLVETGKSLSFVCLSFKIFSWPENILNCNVGHSS